MKASDGKILEAQREKLKAAETVDDAASSEAAQQKPEQSSEGSGSSSESSSETKTPSSKYIGSDKALSIALKDAGVSSGSADVRKNKLDWDDGVRVYEIKFYVGNTEYEYEINATTGAIIDKDADYDDDWDDDYDDEWDD